MHHLAEDLDEVDFGSSMFHTADGGGCCCARCAGATL